MNKETSTVLLKQHVTEKGTHLQAAHQYIFKVHPKATKLQIKKSVETGFNVKVAAINTANMPGKTRRSGKSVGRRSDWKKAYITLLDGYSINTPESEAVKD